MISLFEFQQVICFPNLSLFGGKILAHLIAEFWLIWPSNFGPIGGRILAHSAAEFWPICGTEFGSFLILAVIGVI
jgi:hypothetical protein